MDTTKAAPPRTRSLVARVVRAALVVSGLAAWAALAGLYLLDASPLTSLEIVIRWARAGDVPAAGHQATGAMRLTP